MPAQQLALQFDAPAESAAKLRVLSDRPATTATAADKRPAPTSAAPSVVSSPSPVLAPIAPLDAVLPTTDPELKRRELERYLRLSLGMRVHLTVTDNRRNLFSWRRQADGVTLRLHHMFLTAGPDAARALAEYMSGTRARLRDIRRFIQDNMHQVRPVQAPEAEHADGIHHNLRAIYDVLNLRYFDGQCAATIAWGKLPARTRRRRTSMRLGSYTLGDAAIRIHPLLDDHRVPLFFVASVVHHEMLHHMVPAREVNGRLQYHSPEFRKREREFEHFELAARWEKEHIHELLRR